MEFFDAITQGFRNAGIEASYDRGVLDVAGVKISCYQRRSFYYCLGERFRRTQTLECMQRIVSQLPRLLREKAARVERDKHEALVRPAVAALERAGMQMSYDGRSISLRNRISDGDVRELLKLLVAYQVVKGKVHYDQAAFIQCILDSDGDTTPVLVYADWLEENGHEADAMMLRNRVEDDRNAT